MLETIQEHGIHEDCIWNFDGTGFAMGLCTISRSSLQLNVVRDLAHLSKEIVNGLQLWSVLDPEVAIFHL